MKNPFIIPADSFNYNVILHSNNDYKIYPYLKSFENNSDLHLWNVSPLHGRSYVVCKNNEGRFVILKGAGLNYAQHLFLRTNESKYDVWGLLLKQDAIRDFNIGNEVAKLGIQTNHMHSVIELTNVPYYMDGTQLRPILLQYDVLCPYRIEDAAFVNKQVLWHYVHSWEKYNVNKYDDDYIIAADILLSNLRILHDANILHNAITTHNYTWALELLDFEIASSPTYPYTSEDDERHKQNLYQREVLDVYKIIMYIAHVLTTPVNHEILQNLFVKYGFDLQKYALKKNT